MDRKEIIQNILSKDPGRIAEAKQGIKDILTARANQFRTDVTGYVAKKIFESHTMHGPFSVGAAVKDEHTGLHGVVTKVPFGTEHIHTVAFPDKDPVHYGPEDIPRLKHADVDNLPDAIKMLQGQFPKG